MRVVAGFTEIGASGVVEAWLVAGGGNSGRNGGSRGMVEQVVGRSETCWLIASLALRARVAVVRQELLSS